jgi:hypothetical protein
MSPEEPENPSDSSPALFVTKSNIPHKKARTAMANRLFDRCVDLPRPTINGVAAGGERGEK